MLHVYGVKGCGPYEVTKLFLGSRHVPFRFSDVETQPDKQIELRDKLGSLTSGVILEDGDDVRVMQSVSVAKLSAYLKDYIIRHPA